MDPFYKWRNSGSGKERLGCKNRIDPDGTELGTLLPLEESRGVGLGSVLLL